MRALRVARRKVPSSSRTPSICRSYESTGTRSIPWRKKRCTGRRAEKTQPRAPAELSVRSAFQVTER